MSLAKMMKGAALPVTPRHERWLAQGDPRYSKRALNFAADQLSRNVGGQRAGRERLFRASGAGQCLRKRMFLRIGVPEQRGVDTRLQNIFNNGNMTHLRWQMAGLTEGWLAEAEVPADRPDLGIGTTLDGVLFDDSTLEFKSINTRGFSIVMDYGPDYKHLMQVHYGFKASGKAKGSIIYEDKNTQDFREFVVVLDPAVMRDVDAELDVLIDGWQRRSLPPLKPNCVAQEGSEYRNCPFRDICPKLKTFGKAESLVPKKEIAP